MIQRLIKSKKLRNLAKALNREREGITGLETAIILIAFVVVASVFAYTVLSAGLFSSQKAQEAVYQGLASARSSLEIKGSIIAKSSNGSNVTSMIVTLANALDGEAIDLTPPTDGDSDGVGDSSSTNVCVISYHSPSIVTRNIMYSSTLKGWGDSDDLLEAGEKFEVTIDLTGVGEEIDEYDQVTLEIKPPIGSVLIIDKNMPGAIDSIMILH